MKILYVYYDLRVAPLSFDFAWYLAVACATAEQQDSKLSVTLFYPFFRNSNSIEKGFDAGYRMWKLHNVLVRLCSLCPRVVEVVCNGSQRIDFRTPHFPTSYHPATVDVSSGLTPLPLTHNHLDVAMMGMKNKVVFESTAYADRWFRARFGQKKVVMMSVRTTPHNAPRNAPLVVWYGVYLALRNAGYHCVIIPDQDDYLATREYKAHDWEVVEEASIDLDLRLAIYRNALCAVTWTGGATAPLLLCGAAFMMFGIWNESSVVSSKEFMSRKGPTFGVQPPWFDPERQIYDWTPAEQVSTEYVLDKALPWMAKLAAS